MKLRREVMTEPKTTMSPGCHTALLTIIGLVLSMAVLQAVYLIDRLERNDALHEHYRHRSVILQHAECARPVQCVGLRLLSDECATRLIELSGLELVGP